MGLARFRKNPEKNVENMKKSHNVSGNSTDKAFIYQLVDRLNYFFNLEIELLIAKKCFASTLNS